MPAYSYLFLDLRQESDILSPLGYWLMVRSSYVNHVKYLWEEEEVFPYSLDIEECAF